MKGKYQNNNFLKIYKHNKSIRRFYDGEFCEECNISTATLARYKNGTNNFDNIPAKTLMLISKYFNVKPKTLLNDYEKEIR